MKKPMGRVKKMNRNKANMPVFHTELAGNTNSCLPKIHNSKYQVLLDSGAEVLLVHIRLYNSWKVRPK